MPSSTATREGPCDSPAVSHRSMRSLCRSNPAAPYDGHAKAPHTQSVTGPSAWVVLAELVAVHRAGGEVERRAVAELHGGRAVLHRQEREVAGEGRPARVRGTRGEDRVGLGEAALAVAVA